jgi:hypothetical protein
MKGVKEMFLNFRIVQERPRRNRKGFIMIQRSEHGLPRTTPPHRSQAQALQVYSLSDFTGSRWDRGGKASLPPSC